MASPFRCSLHRLGAAILLLCAAGCAPSVAEPMDARTELPLVAAAPILVEASSGGSARVWTRREPVSATYFGTRVVDPYRWLEDDEDAAVKEWISEQNARTERALEQVPDRADIRRRVEQLLAVGEISRPVVVRGRKGFRYFYTRRHGRQDQPMLLVRDRLEAADQIVVDPNALSATGTISLDWFYPSLDGKLVAYGTSEGGSELSTLRIRDVDRGRDLGDVIPYTRHSSVCWLPNGRSFYYARYPKPGTVPDGEEAYHRKIFFHEIGESWQNDSLVFGDELEKMTDFPSCDLSPNGRWLVISVHKGWSQSELYVGDTRRRPVSFTRATRGDERLYRATVLDDRVYVVTDDGAPRFRLMAFDPKRPERASWTELIAEHETDVLKRMAVIGNEVVATYLHDAAARIERFDRTGRSIEPVALPGFGTSRGVSGHHAGREAFYDYESFDEPRTVFHLDLGSGESSVFSKIPAPAGSRSVKAERHHATSRDGTQVPYFVVRAADGPAREPLPTVLYGYGGFNISLEPRYLRSVQLLLERGLVYVQAVLRGGGELGRDWHRAGQLENKQHVFDDFIAVAERLIDTRVTTRDELAIWGRSNGGLLVAAAITQRPGLFRAAVAGVPLTDMLRYQHFLLAKLWIPEYGSSENPEQFRYLYEYSPYHRVRRGTEYPAVLLTTAANDSRVHPMHARKMAAALQHASTSDRPILLRSETAAGHGSGKALHQTVEEYADVYAFLLWQLGRAGQGE